MIQNISDFPLVPPEQFFMQHTQRRSITQQTGVWSAASSIIEMCCGKRVNQTESFANPLYTSGQITSGEPKILFNTVALPYSKKLIETLLRCLAFNPTERIKISAVVRLAQKVVDQFDAIERVISDNPLHNRTEVNLLPGNKTIHSLGDYTPLTFKVGGVRRDDQYVCGNEPPLPPERGPPLLFDSVFFGSEKVIGDGKTLADYPYTMLEAGAEPAQRTRRSKK
jgi:serine/threonine protein kinase